MPATGVPRCRYCGKPLEYMYAAPGGKAVCRCSACGKMAITCNRDIEEMI